MFDSHSRNYTKALRVGKSRKILFSRRHQHGASTIFSVKNEVAEQQETFFVVVGEMVRTSAVHQKGRLALPDFCPLFFGVVGVVRAPLDARLAQVLNVLTYALYDLAHLATEEVTNAISRVQVCPMFVVCLCVVVVDIISPPRVQ